MSVDFRDDEGGCNLPLCSKCNCSERSESFADIFIPQFIRSAWWEVQWWIDNHPGTIAIIIGIVVIAIFCFALPYASKLTKQGG